MSFSIFTKASTRISTPLRWLGRGFQLWGGLAGAAVIGSAIFFAMNPAFLEKIPPATRALLGLRIIVLGGASAASLYFIGRALLRRQRSGLYGAAVVIFAPMVVRAAFGARFAFGAPDLLFGLAAAALIGSVWKEVHDNAVELEDPDEEGLPLTPRNRGYGERQRLGSAQSSHMSPTREEEKVRVDR